MRASDHPEFSLEQAHLDHTLAALNAYVRSLRDQPAGGADEHTSRVLKAGFDERAGRLQDVLASPYFGRVDFQHSGEAQVSQYYIGREGFESRGVQVVNWRAPLARLFYQGQAGRMAFASRQGGEQIRVEGDLFLKRNLGIMNHVLSEISDVIDVRPAQPGQPAAEVIDPDEYLRQILAGRHDVKLADIVATIQAQQYELIQAPAKQVLVIQGVAGSGKTSIALHRLAYLLYPDNNSAALDPGRCIIFGPNRLFMSYIAQVLPGLGVDKLPQTTLEEWALEQLGLTDLRRRDRTLEAILDPELPRDVKANHFRSSQFKSSRRMGQLLENLVELRRQPAFPAAGLSYSGIGPLKLTLAISAAEIMTIWNSLRAVALARQQERLIELVHGRLAGQYNALVEERAKELAERGEKLLAGARNLQTDAERMQSYEQYARNAHDEILEEQDTPAGLARGRQSLLELSDYLQRTGEPIVLRAKRLRDEALADTQRRQDMDRLRRHVTRDVHRYWPPIDPLKDYYAMLADDDLLKRVNHSVFKPKELELLHQTVAPAKGELDLSDLAPIHFLHTLVQGVEVGLYDHVVIDEAQDIAPLQLETIRRYSRNGAFTILGDLAQSIYAHRGLASWEEVKNALVSDQPYNYQEITRSYRSTYEIMQFANRVLQVITPRGRPSVLAQPFERHGPAPKVHRLNSAAELTLTIAQIVEQVKRDGYRNIALIAKTAERCEALAEELRSVSFTEFDIATTSDFEYQGATLLLPVHLAKGMEFEAALVLEADEKTYPATEYDGRLLYVALTRGLHRLDVLAVGRVARCLQ